MATCWIPLHPPSHAHQNVSRLEVLNLKLKHSNLHSSTTTENPVFLGLQSLLWVASSAPMATCWIPLHPPPPARPNVSWLEVLNLTLKQPKMHSSTTTENPVFCGLQSLIWFTSSAPIVTCWIPLHPPSHARENECLLEVLNLTLKQSKMHLSTTIQSAAIIVITLT